ncbi:RING/U-box superfamily protein, putative [Theobroma cacao]|uniref:RING-type E3 ubiquitin transferase n=1 Tax=Theobroma cacao TaxID=3641 RepID=A0A061FKY9_THECC|nr:RING/U-box superfamily protein, putative [Theobroma cacao]
MASSQDSQPFHWHYAELEDRDFQIRGRTLFFIIVLFSFVLVFTLIFVYSRWICSFHRDNSSTRSPTSHAPPQPRPEPRGLDPVTINALPITMVTRGRKSAAAAAVALESECCICLGVFEDGEKVKVLPACQHSYHSECVDRWLSAESSCPLCRASLRAESELHQIPVIVVVVVSGEIKVMLFPSLTFNTIIKQFRIASLDGLGVNETGCGLLAAGCWLLAAVCTLTSPESDGCF